jgi:hypothetical protein
VKKEVRQFKQNGAIFFSNNPDRTDCGSGEEKANSSKMLQLFLSNIRVSYLSCNLACEGYLIEEETETWHGSSRMPQLFIKHLMYKPQGLTVASGKKASQFKQNASIFYQPSMYHTAARLVW